MKRLNGSTGGLKVFGKQGDGLPVSLKVRAILAWRATYRAYRKVTGRCWRCSKRPGHPHKFGCGRGGYLW